MSDNNNFLRLHPRHLYYTPDNLRTVYRLPDVDKFEWQVSSPEGARQKSVICRDPEQGRHLFSCPMPTNVREALLMGYILGKSAGYFEDEGMWHYIMSENPEYQRYGYGNYDPEVPPISEDEDNFSDPHPPPAPEPYWPCDDLSLKNDTDDKDVEIISERPDVLEAAE